MTEVLDLLATAGAAAGLAAGASAAVLLVRWLLVVAVTVWSMRTDDDKKRLHALSLLAFLCPRRGRELAAEHESAGTESKAAAPETVVSTT
ncbi:hypothetical protein [Paractinoplanes lichenicola]|uniref:Uncharacterized protein n=1 Tax=Paractinoplanes lichenicola TaxID=2802976 RepID=A0ABS1VGN0_9ACTN|nr:hypothetical protein [Actinoplanes lichenicola]MBL7253870.1 hypothetical protein [Actinoplanes lichenicola]